MNTCLARTTWTTVKKTQIHQTIITAGSNKIPEKHLPTNSTLSLKVPLQPLPLVNAMCVLLHRPPPCRTPRSPSSLPSAPRRCPAHPLSTRTSTCPPRPPPARPAFPRSCPASPLFRPLSRLPCSSPPLKVSFQLLKRT